MNRSIINQLKLDIARNDIPSNRRNFQRFHKEPLREPVGLSTAVLRKISNRRFKELRGLTTADMLALCDGLAASQERYMKFFAFDWAEKLKGQYSRTDFKRFHRWLVNHIGDWGSCDHLCYGAMGHLIFQYPDLTSRTDSWLRSRNRWLRRAAAVSLIVAVRNGELIERVFVVAGRLMNDGDDLVQKACGWMLKEGSRRHQQQVFEYLLVNRAQMSRTTLRYAIEKLPNDLRRKVMEWPK